MCIFYKGYRDWIIEVKICINPQFCMPNLNFLTSKIKGEVSGVDYFQCHYPANS